MHTQEHMLSKCTLRTCYPSAWYTRVLLVHHQSRAPLVLVHLSCITSTRAPISCTSTLVHSTRSPISCTHLVHHSTRAPISCTQLVLHPYRAQPISCTTPQSRAPLRILVHLSCTAVRAPLVPLSCTTHKLPQLSWHFPLPGRRNFYSCTIVYHSVISCTTT